MKFVSVETMREMDRAAIEAGTPGSVLMDRAGRAIASALLEASPRSILFFAGRGNNGGDAFAAANYLQRAGVRCEIWIACAPDQLADDVLPHRDLAQEAGVPIRFFHREHDWKTNEIGLPLIDIAVDCLLGTGSGGAPRGTITCAVECINALPPNVRVVAVDVPTGMDASSGTVHAPCVRADQTLTIGLPKNAFLNEDARAMTGSIEVLDIGLGRGPDNNPELQMIGAPLPRTRRRNSHKGTYGHLLCIGGAAGYTGAIGLAARAALRAGAGLVTVVTPQHLVPVVAATCPEAMVRGAAETATGSISIDGGWDAFGRNLGDFDALLMGPGMTRHEDTLQLARRVLRDVEMPMLFDADALNVFHGRAHWFVKARGPVVLTPHPGELARLLAEDIRDIQANRYKFGRMAVEESGATVVLKGSGTLVLNKREGWINLNGNPHLATAGSGDVLAGLLGGLLAQGLSALDASREAVYRHGRAGDRALVRSANHSLVASDLLTLI